MRGSMKRYLALAVSVLALVVGMFNQQAAIAQSEQGPEAKAAAFYTWFMQNDSDSTYPLREQNIVKYVAKDTVTRLRDDYAHGGPPQGVDYFLKVQDYD